MSEPLHFAYLGSVRGLALLAVLWVHVAVSTGPSPAKYPVFHGDEKFLPRS
jgi:hypothetical protein